MESESNPRTLTTVEKTCAILEALWELDGAGVTELADHLDISKGGAYNHLATLHEERYVVKNGGEYELSHRFFNMGEYVKHHNKLYDAGRAEIDQLAEKTGESAHLMIEQFGKGIYYYEARGRKGLSQEWHRNLLEENDYLHWAATGKSILANLPEPRVREITDHHGMPRATENTITEPERLFEELETVRERGYALNDEEQIRGVRAVGTWVTDNDGDVLGSISVSGPTSRIDDERFFEELPEIVMQSANVIEVTLDTRYSVDEA